MCDPDPGITGRTAIEIDRELYRVAATIVQVAKGRMAPDELAPKIVEVLSESLDSWAIRRLGAEMGRRSYLRWPGGYRETRVDPLMERRWVRQYCAHLVWRLLPGSSPVIA